MKVRLDYVTNSSSSCFIFKKKTNAEYTEESIFNLFSQICKDVWNTYVNIDKDIKENMPDTYHKLCKYFEDDMKHDEEIREYGHAFWNWPEELKNKSSELYHKCEELKDNLASVMCTHIEKLINKYGDDAISIFVWDSYFEYSDLIKINKLAQINTLEDLKAMIDWCDLEVTELDTEFDFEDYMGNATVITHVDIGDIIIHGARDMDIPYAITYILLDIADCGTNHNG